MHRHVALLLLAGLALATTPAAAEGRWKAERAALAPSEPDPGGLWMPVQARTLSLSQVRSIIASRVPGSIADAELTTLNGRPVYIVRWEPSDDQLRGRILIFVVDAESGAILSQRGG